ncbi:MAG: DNA-protecting protein DprA [Parvularculaceae bacterium]|nr:DNA-protecting protein DprA [Parvularculaceae bacterium]
MVQAVSFEERRARLRLIRSAGIGPLTYQQLMARLGCAVDAIDALPDLAKEASRRPIRLANDAAVDRELETGAAQGMALISVGEPDYPAALAAIPDPPACLWILGEARWLHEPTLAMVGARNASAAGRQLTDNLAGELGSEGYVIASGLARGIDGVAHRAAIATGTVAVLAGGTDQIYPPEHADLHRDIAERGAVISEQPLGMVARAQDFPKRNRIVSGLSQGVIVVEAAERSGTLITARLASEQGREVFAVPGSPLDPRSAGTNRLIKKGAVLVRDAADVLADLGPRQQVLCEPAPDELLSSHADDEVDETFREQLVSLLSFTPTHADVLIAELGAPARLVTACLLELVLEGIAAEETGGTYVLAASSDVT